MAKYITLVSGELAEASGVATSAGAGDAGKIVQLDSSGRLDTTMMPVGIAADTKSLVTSENLTAGNLVNIYDNTGTPTARKADGANGREAHGFVLASTTSPAAAIVYKEGTISGLSGLTAGSSLYLSATTAGAITATAPSGSGQISQRIGTALSATEADFAVQRKITLV